ncbi:septum site-determining protein MinC [Ruminiclostridium sufflavum DSM 19573]|uniref:Probable septum site-determining protein MinC n=1 Tax=Ruminiclostridium sufflavum DSM 19573 TaxID=1121337 RepID=A0A318XL52_9FIRM|nr:septum site-determining protein MinC [Ruminiclostridium sufflavum]PYG87291.1 septum site-determining protein MinC [Ruminiclostridium sufflavum DSM 19573]
MDENAVTFKGTVNGLTIILKQDAGFDDIVNSLLIKINSAGKFFRGAKLAVKYRGRTLNQEERYELHELLKKESGAQILSFDEDMTENKLAETKPSSTERNNQIKKYTYFKGIEEGTTKFYRGTVRSGQLITFDGNLVVLGDVNPGAVIEATGNIVVMGLLRGVVHAGSNGNKDAIVAALGLNPTQLRIGDIITRSPDDEKGIGTNLIPELAYVREDKLFVERFLPQR